VFNQRGEHPLLPFGNPIGFVPASRGGVYIKLIMADLRTFLETAKRSAPEAYLEIKEKHDINLEVCALVGKLEKQRHTPLLLFSNIDNLSGEPSEFPLDRSL